MIGCYLFLWYGVLTYTGIELLGVKECLRIIWCFVTCISIACLCEVILFHLLRDIKTNVFALAADVRGWFQRRKGK